MPEPVMIKSLILGIRASSVKKVWVASPDCYDGAPQQLLFRQEGEYVVFTVPSLKYWMIIVIEK
jgi:dextranase